MANGADYLVTTDVFLELVPNISTTLSDGILQEFEQDCERYTRY